MNGQDVATLVGLIVSVVSVAVAIVAILRSSNRDSRTDIVSLENRLTTLEQRTVSLPPITDRIIALETQVRALQTFDPGAIGDRLARLEVKMDVYWTGLAKDAARVLRGHNS